MDSRGKGTKTRFDRAETLSIRNTFFAHDLIRKRFPLFGIMRERGAVKPQARCKYKSSARRTWNARQHESEQMTTVRRSIRNIHWVQVSGGRPAQPKSVASRTGNE